MLVCCLLADLPKLFAASTGVILTILAAQEKGVIVVDMNGKKLGMANAHSFVAALATSDVKENKPKI